MLSGRFQGFWLLCETVKMILSSKNQKREMKFQVSRHLSCRLTRRAVTSTVPPWLTHASPTVATSLSQQDANPRPPFTLTTAAAS